MTNKLNKKEIEIIEDIILDEIVEEINNFGTTFNFLKKVYNDYEKNDFNSIDNIDFYDSIVYNLFDNVHGYLLKRIGYELNQLSIYSTNDLIDDFLNI